MPRSFLVKKYFSNKRPNYSQLESQSDRFCPIIPTHFAPNVLPKMESDTQFPNYPSLLMWTPAALTFGSVSACIPCPPRPLDLSSQSSSSGEEDHCRTSDPPSPDPTERFQCTHCGKTCSSPGLLSRHQLRQCSASLETIATSVESSGGTAKTTFRCKNCPKEYNSLGALKMHIRSHTLPCVCSTCGKAFSRPWLLRGHIRTHTGERPFSCPHCNRAFADRSNLRAHLQTHSQVKKYQCGVCSRTFSRMSLLNKHTHFGCCPST